jgi:hypothetical protein
MEKKTTHGGARRGAGRLPIADKKSQVNIYPLQSRIEALGINRLKIIALEAIEKEFEKNLKKT